MLFLKKISLFLFLIFIIDALGMKITEPNSTLIQQNISFTTPTAYYYPVDQDYEKILSALEPNTKGVVLPDNRLCLWLTSNKKNEKGKNAYLEDKKIIIINSFLEQSLNPHKLLAFYAHEQLINERPHYIHFAFYQNKKSDGSFNIYLHGNPLYMLSSYKNGIPFLNESLNNNDILFNDPAKSNLYVFNPTQVDSCFLFAFVCDKKNKDDTNHNRCHIGMYRPNQSNFKRSILIDKEVIFKKAINRYTSPEQYCINNAFDALYRNQLTENGTQYSIKNVTANASYDISIDDIRIIHDLRQSKIFFLTFIRLFFYRLIDKENVELVVYCILKYTQPASDLQYFSITDRETDLDFLQIETEKDFFKDPIYFKKNSDDIPSNQVLPVFFTSDPKKDSINENINYFVVPNFEDYFKQSIEKKRTREIQIIQPPLPPSDTTIDYYKFSEQLPAKVEQKFTVMINTLETSSKNNADQTIKNSAKKLIPIIDTIKIMYADLHKTLHLLEMHHNMFTAQKNDRDEEVKKGVETLTLTSQNGSIKIEKQIADFTDQIKALPTELQKVSNNIQSLAKDSQNTFKQEFKEIIAKLIEDFLNILGKHATEHDEKIKKLEDLQVKTLSDIKQNYENPLKKIKDDGENNNNKVESQIKANQILLSQLNNEIKNAKATLTEIKTALKNLEQFQENIIKIHINPLTEKVSPLIEKVTSQETRLTTLETTKKRIEELLKKALEEKTALNKKVDQLEVNYASLLTRFTELKNNYDESQEALKKAEKDPSKNGWNWRLNIVTLVSFIIVVQWLAQYAQANYGITMPTLSIGQLK